MEGLCSGLCMRSRRRHSTGGDTSTIEHPRHAVGTLAARVAVSKRYRGRWHGQPRTRSWESGSGLMPMKDQITSVQMSSLWEHARSMDEC